MPLYFASMRPEHLSEGDIIAFDYANPGHNQISRCGIVHNFVGKTESRCVVLYDWSLETGTGYRSYDLRYIRGLGKIVERQQSPPPMTTFKENLAKFLDRFS